ncbi:hypothetical protein [Peterkaempfera sp. SMS 1(5)a]|uniref:hypothetical protein n=1 Tax=Peterkaempfera podocarpi TaxID=3232308 RepID=UPI00366C2045
MRPAIAWGGTGIPERRCNGFGRDPRPATPHKRHPAGDSEGRPYQSGERLVRAVSYIRETLPAEEAESVLGRADSLLRPASDR